MRIRSRRTGGDRAPFRADIQALRALAVMSVLVYHLWPNRLTGGFVGVDVFFVISGYLITSHLVREREATGRIALGAFWARRAARLLPASLLVLLATSIAVVVLVPRTLWQQFLGEITASALYVQNWRLLFDSVDYLAADNQPSPVQHFWTLSAEEQFYVMLPLLLIASAWAFRRFSWRRVAFFAIAAATLVSFCYGVWLTATAPSEAYFSTFSRAWEFGLGALLSFAPAVRMPRLGAVLGVVGTAAILFAVISFSGTTPFPGPSALIPTLGTALAIWGGRAGILEPIGRFAPIALLGRVSYAVYLWHWPLIILVPFALGEPLTTIQKLAIGVLSLGLAWVSTTYVEDVVRGSTRFLKGRRPRTIAAWSAAGMVVVLVASLTPAQIARVQAEQERAVTEQILEAGVDCLGAEAMDPASPECAAADHSDRPLIPAPEAIDDDDDNRVECWSNRDETELDFCQLGPESGYEKHLVAVGDSHNNTLMGAYEQIASERNWRIDVTGKASCGWNRIPLPSSKQSYVDACETWRDAFEAFTAEHPEVDAYITTKYSTKRDASDAAVASMAESWGLRADAENTPVIAIVDNPTYPEAPVHCIVTDPATANERCSLPQSRVLWDDGLARAAALDPNGHVIDLTDFYCADGVCPVVIGGVIVYRDVSHITATYAKTLAPYIARELSAVLG